MDEWDFMVAARSWPLNGAAVPHPPGYVHLLRLIFAVFGESTTVARIPGIACAVASLWLIPPIVRKVFPDMPDRDAMALIAVWLFGLSPLTTQNAILVDIDNTLMMPVLAMLFMAWFDLREGGGLRRVVVLGLWIGIALWIKFPPPLLVLFAFSLDLLWEMDAKNLKRLVAAVCIGISLFALTFALEAWWTGFGLAELGGTLHKVALLFQWRRVLVTLPQTAGVFAMWLTIPLTILALVGVVQSLRTPAAPNARTLAWFVLVAGVFYAYINGPAYGFPKYQSILLPSLSILSAVAILEAWTRLPSGMRLLGLAILGLSISVQLLIGDPLYGFFQVTGESSVSELALRATRAGKAVLVASVPALLGIAVAAAVALVRGRRFRELAVISLCGAFFGQAAAIMALQGSAAYSTRYHYGSDIADYLETCAELVDKLPADSFIITPKDILYQTGFRGRFVNELVREELRPDSLLSVMSKHDVRALVLTPREESRAQTTLLDPRVKSILDTDFISQRIGEYQLLLRAPGQP